MKQEQMVALAEKIKTEAFSKFFDAKHDGTSYEAVKELEVEYNTAFNLYFYVKYPALARFQGAA